MDFVNFSYFPINGDKLLNTPIPNLKAKHNVIDILIRLRIYIITVEYDLLMYHFR